MARANALSLAIARAAAHDAVLVRTSDRAATFELKVTLVDGRKIDRRIRVTAYGDTLSAQESPARDLPTYCPGRHINDDASFCLGWSGHETGDVLDDAGAILWWCKLLQFLRLQERAAKLRRWPDRRAWAHGAAARFQQAAEAAAAMLGPTFVTALEWNRLEVEGPVMRGSANGPAYTLLLERRPVLRVWQDYPRLVNMRQPCICDARAGRVPIAMRSCGGHAAAGVALVRSLLGWRDAESKYWKSVEGKPCCGTLDDCPLKRGPAETQSNDRMLSSHKERKAA